MPEKKSPPKLPSKASFNVVKNVIPANNEWRYHSTKIVVNKEFNHFTRKMRENFITLVISVIGMGTAITWSDVVKTTIDVFFHERSALFAKFYVALLVTLVALMITYMISRVKDKKPE